MRISRLLLVLLGAAACGDNAPFELDAPRAGVSDVITTVGEDGSVAVTIPVDGDASAMSFAVSTPQHGSVSGAGPVFMYHPGSQFAGTDSFRVTITRGAKSTFVPVFIHVHAVNDPPVASDDSFVTAEDTALVIPTSAVIANDVDIDSKLTVVAVSQPEDDTFCVGLTPCRRSSVELDGATITYRPYRNLNGDQTFTYTVSDGQFTSTARVTVHVTSVNDAPDAGNDVLSVAQDTALVIEPSKLLANDWDLDGETPFVNSVGNPSHGAVTIVDGEVVFTPAPGYVGSDAGFDYAVSDGMLTAVAHVEVDVLHVNHAPVASAGSFAVDQDSSYTFDLVATDPDGDDLVFIVAAPAWGQVVLDGAKLTYTPEPGYAGPDAFQFRAYDGEAMSEFVTVSITVTSACAHDVCSTGCALPAIQNECTQAVCSHDSACCDDTWGPECVDEVVSYCGIPCA